MKLFYKPFALIASFFAARIGRTLFRGLWSRIDDREPPAPEAPHTSYTKAIVAATLEAATMASVAAAVDRTSAKAFHHLTGVWPGEDPEEG